MDDKLRESDVDIFSWLIGSYALREIFDFQTYFTIGFQSFIN
jgi:hypothetical protein